jgi:hypothetical protein
VSAALVGADQQGRLERAPPRRGQLRQHVVEPGLEQVAEDDVGELALRFRRPGRKDPQRPLTGGLDRSQPEARLADAGLALEHDGARPVACTVEEAVQGGHLVVTAHELDCHVSDRDSAGGDSSNLPYGCGTTLR